MLIDENDARTEYESIFVAKNEKMDIQILNDYIKKLQDCQNIAEILKEIVPEFNHNKDGN